MNRQTFATNTSTRSEPCAVLDGQGTLVDAGSVLLVSRLLKALRVRWRLWTATAALGLIGAAVLSAAFPLRHSATTLVFVRHEANGADPARAMETNVALAMSRAVAQRAIDRLGLSLSASQLVSEYEAIALSNELLRIVGKGPTAAEAARRASALAEEFLEFRGEVVDRQAQAAVAALDERRSALDAELSKVNTEIEESSVGGDPGNSSFRSARLGNLLGRRAGLNAEQAEVRRRIDEAVFGTSLIVNSSGIVDPATLDDRSPITALAANLAAGIVIGLAVGIGWVIVEAVASEGLHISDQRPGRTARAHDGVSPVVTSAPPQ